MWTPRRYPVSGAHYDLPEPDRRSLYDDRVAGYWFNRLYGRAMLLEDERLTGRWLLDIKKEVTSDGPHLES